MITNIAIHPSASPRMDRASAPARGSQAGAIHCKFGAGSLDFGDGRGLGLAALSGPGVSNHQVWCERPKRRRVVPPKGSLLFGCRRHRMSHPRDPGPAFSPKARGAKYPKAFEALRLWSPLTESSDPSGSTKISVPMLRQNSQILPHSRIAHGSAAASFGGCFPASPLSL